MGLLDGLFENNPAYDRPVPVGFAAVANHPAFRRLLLARKEFALRTGVAPTHAIVSKEDWDCLAGYAGINDDATLQICGLSVDCDGPARIFRRSSLLVAGDGRSRPRFVEID